MRLLFFCFDNFTGGKYIKFKILLALCREEDKSIASFLLIYLMGICAINASFLCNLYKTHF